MQRISSGHRCSACRANGGFRMARVREERKHRIPTGSLEYLMKPRPCVPEIRTGCRRRQVGLLGWHAHACGQAAGRQHIYACCRRRSSSANNAKCSSLNLAVPFFSSQYSEWIRCAGCVTSAGHCARRRGGWTARLLLQAACLSGHVTWCPG